MDDFFDPLNPLGLSNPLNQLSQFNQSAPKESRKEPTAVKPKESSATEQPDGEVEEPPSLVRIFHRVPV
eukprot:674372-Pyramimonas_sp.AAC.1